MIYIFNKPPHPVTVEELRQFIHDFGPDVTVLVTWSHETGYQFVTVGLNREYADAAVHLRDLIAQALQLNLGNPLEDLRQEHQDKPWTDAQKEALLRVLDSVSATLDDVPLEKKLQFIYVHHLQRRLAETHGEGL
jgi:hypothetical protein